MVTVSDLTTDAPDDIFRVWSTTLAFGPESFLFEGFEFPTASST